MENAHILVVEDERLVALDIRNTLTSLGYVVTADVCSGAEAIKTAGETHPDLVLMDIRLEGDMDGVEAATEIRARFDIPVVYLTAYSDDETLERAKITEPYGYIIKPIQDRELQTTIEISLYRHEMEGKLRESERWLATTLRCIGDGVITTDTDGHVRSMNPVAEALTGWRVGEALGRDVADIFAVLDEGTRERVENPIRRVLQSGVALGLTSHFLRDQCGGETPIDDSTAPIKDDKGNMVGVVLAFHDVTERKQAEQVLRETANQLKGLLNAIPEVLLIENEKHEIVWANDGARHLLNIKEGDRSVVPIEVTEQLIKGHKDIVIRKVKHEGMALECKSRILSDSRGTTVLSMLTDVTKLDELLQTMLAVTPSQTEEESRGGEVNVLSLLSDVSELEKVAAHWSKIAEENEQKAVALERSNAELEQFAYVASHDLQEPLRMVASYTQLLARRYQGRLDADADEFIGYAVDGATRMQGLIQGLLAYSRVSTHTTDFEPTDSEAAFDQAIADLRKAVEESGAVVTHERLPTVMADETQLGQLFQNLIGNAIKFHGEQPPRVHISAEQQGNEWVFAVRDNGIGIDPEYSERIFIVFQRLHGKADYPGTGIGLAICKKIVERHGGRIWIESSAGQGSTFYFTIPQAGGKQSWTSEQQPQPRRQRALTSLTSS